MKLMNRRECVLGLGWADMDVQDGTVVRIDDNLGIGTRWRASISQIHQLTKVRLCWYLHHGHVAGSKVFFDRLNQLGFWQELWAGADVPAMGVQPMVDITFKRHDAARHTQKDQKQCRDQAQL